MVHVWWRAGLLLLFVSALSDVAAKKPVVVFDAEDDIDLDHATMAQTTTRKDGEFVKEHTKEFHLPHMDGLQDAMSALEEESDTVMSASVGEGATAEPITPLSCKCNAYVCMCRKECLCKVVEQPFNGKQVQAAAKTAKAAKAAKNANPLVFKCACDFGGADFTMSPKEGLDCDCAGAKCKCQKKCVCKANEKKKAAPAAKPTVKKTSFEETGLRKEQQDSFHVNSDEMLDGSFTDAIPSDTFRDDTVRSPLAAQGNEMEQNSLVFEDETVDGMRPKSRDTDADSTVGHPPREADGRKVRKRPDRPTQ